MSVSRTSNYTPRSSASHGRIVTQNSSLSAALLREKSEGVVLKDSRSASVNPTALDVVSSDVNASPIVSNTVDKDSSVQYVVVSKSRLSLNHASNTESPLHANQTNPITPLADVERVAETYRKEEADEEVHPIQAAQVKDSIEHNRYSYHSLKKSGRVSVNNTDQELVRPGTKTSVKGEGEVSNKEFGEKSDSSVLFLTAESNNKSVVGNGDNHVVNANNSAYLNSRSASHSQDQRGLEQGYQSNSTLAENKSDSHQEKLEHQPRLETHQHTRLSLHSQHDRVSRDRVPLSVNPSEKSVPPLDLSCFTPDKAPSEHSDSSSDILISSKSQLQVQLSDQKLHASDRNSSVLHFSAHDYNHTATGRKTYEVESPIVSSQLPHVKSSANFSGQLDTYRDERRQDPQPLQQGEEQVEPTRSDLADDLNIPYQFDTQANSTSRDSPRPPSPPVQTTPPPQPEPATSLRGKSNSTVYAVANPEVLRAQGISPSQGGQNVSNPSRRSDHAEVRFDSAYRQPRPDSERRSPIRDRAPTPYARTPTADNSDTSRSRKESLPPQHPPLDTKHNTPKPDSLSRKNSVNTVKRVYVESPSFTREEEDEYRFVNSRLEDIEDKDKTYREMDGKQRGYGGDDMNYSQGYQATQQRDSMRQGQPIDNRQRQEQPRYEDKSQDRYDKRNRDRYEEENRGDRYDDRNRDRYDNRNHDRYDDRNNGQYDNRGQNRYEDRNDNRYNDKNHDRKREKYGTQPQDRYEDRNNEINGYGDRNKQRDSDRYEDRDRYDRDSYEQERYDRLHDERARYEQEMNRDPEPDFNRYRKQTTELDEQDLRKEKEYQRNLKKRIDNQKNKDKDSYMESLRHQERDDYDKENFARDSLDYQEETETGRGDPRDSLEYNGYAQRNQDWENPPPNSYQENGYSGNPQYSQYQEQRQDSKPDFYDEEDVRRMEAVFPKPPKYDYVEHNKEDYGRLPQKTYRDIVHRKREEEEKLESVFITPKVPPKGRKGKAKKAYSAQPEHMGHQPPVHNQYPLGFKPSSAEELWAKKAAVLTVKKESAGSNKPKGSAGKPPKWNTNAKVSHPLTYKPPIPMPNQGQAYKPVGQPGSREQGYTTPTRGLHPIENRPAAPTSTELVPTAIQPQSPFRRHMELKPITQEILTEDGQRISVDINLRLISPPPQQSGQVSPSQQQQQQQLALLPVQETQGQYMDDQGRGIGLPYQMQEPYAYDMGYSSAYQEQDMTHTLPINDVEQQISAEELALHDPSGYSKKYHTGTPRTEDGKTDDKKDDEGYTAMYHRNKNKHPDSDPWYKVYNLTDYKKMLREVRLNRGTLGPDLDTEPYKEKLEKRHRQFEYARNVMEKNRMELGTKKQPNFPRSPPKHGEENIKRKAALDYAKTVPKPAVKPHPNQYNSYEVSAQLAQGGLKSPSSTAKATPPPTKTLDVIDIRTLEQRHIAEKKNADKIRQNMDSVLSQKAH